MTTAKEMIERAAREIDPASFDGWWRIYDHRIGLGNAPSEATMAADFYFISHMERARAKARTACAVAVEMCARIIVDEKQRIDTYIFEHDKKNRITEADVRALSASRVLEKVGTNIVGLATAIKGE